jgi:hypothetical protein
LNNVLSIHKSLPAGGWEANSGAPTILTPARIVGAGLLLSTKWGDVVGRRRGGRRRVEAPAPHHPGNEGGHGNMIPRVPHELLLPLPS